MTIKISVSKVMTKDPLTVDKSETISKVAEYMTKKRVGSAIVVDRNKPIGILTETDLTKRIVYPARDPRKVKAGEIMSTPLVFVSPKDDYIAAVDKMKKYKVKRMPVIDNEKIVGILTTTDIARTVPEMMEILEARMRMRLAKPEITAANTSGICEVCGNYSDRLTFADDQWVCENCSE
jgi:CBS domain-containing protein